MPSSRTPPPQRPSGLRGGSSKHISESLPLLGPDGEPISTETEESPPRPSARVLSPRAAALARSGPRVSPPQPRSARRARRAQVLNQLSLIGDALSSRPITSEDKCYLTTILINAPLPYDDLGDADVWVRRSKNKVVTYEAGYADADDPQLRRKVGLPYGIYPRRILTWATTQIIKTRQPEIVHHGSFSDLVRKILDTEPTGGPEGTITRLRDQMTRLLNMKITVLEKRRGPEARGAPVDAAFRLVPIAGNAAFWDPAHPEYHEATELRFRVSADYYNACMVDGAAPFLLPADQALAKARSCRAIDLYRFITVRQYALFMAKAKLPESFDWPQMHSMFGREGERMSNFRAEIASALQFVTSVWRTHGAECRKNAFLIRPTGPHCIVKPRSQQITRKTITDPGSEPSTAIIVAPARVAGEGE